MSLGDGATQLMVSLSLHIVCMIKDAFCCVPVCAEARSDVQQGQISSVNSSIRQQSRLWRYGINICSKQLLQKVLPEFEETAPFPNSITA